MTVSKPVSGSATSVFVSTPAWRVLCHGSVATLTKRDARSSFFPGFVLAAGMVAPRHCVTASPFFKPRFLHHLRPLLRLGTDVGDELLGRGRRDIHRLVFQALAHLRI